MEDVMLDIMYELPEYKNQTITITKDVVNKTTKPKESERSITRLNPKGNR